MTRKILSLSESKEWSAYLNRLPIGQQDVYFTPEYYKLYENNGDGKAFCFVFEKDGELALYPFLRNSINELGYNLDDEYYDIQGAYGYNGVISSSYDILFIEAFYSNFESFCLEKNIIAEFTRFHPLLKNHAFSSNNLSVLFDRKAVFLDISDTIENIWQFSYSSNNRNMIRKALKNNIEIIESNHKNNYIDFYKIYVETMNNVQSNDYLFFNEQYFLNLKDLLSQNHKLILAKFDDEIIGGMILMFSNNFAHYHLSARNRNYGKFALNNLFLDFAIKTAKSLGCKSFHFGGGNTTSENDSLLKFKSNFSKDKSNFYIGKKIYIDDIYNIVYDQWKSKYPLQFECNKQKLLGYREL